ncbi:MAG: galactose-1-epimerase, partial [Thermoguttaceae bacterium]
SGDILGTEVKINADHFTPVDKDQIPTGEVRPVKGTPFDFTAPHTIGERIEQKDEQLLMGGGYDHNFIINKKSPGEMTLCAVARDAAGSRTMEVFTTEPAVQLYVGNFLDGKNIGKGNRPYGRRSGFCLETQHYPDSPNHPDYPTTVLKPGETYKETTVHKFSVQK